MLTKNGKKHSFRDIVGRFDTITAEAIDREENNNEILFPPALFLSDCIGTTNEIDR